MSIPYTAAYATALSLVEKMRPFCERIEIAGSLRRRCLGVKDIEIVAVPRWESRVDSADLFGGETRVNLLYEAASMGFALFCAFEMIRWIKPGVNEAIPWHVEPDGKYWRGVISGPGNTTAAVRNVDDPTGPLVFLQGIKLDLFLCSPENFGLIYAIRTGSAEFSRALVTHAARVGLPVSGGYVTREGEPIATPEERDVFDLLGVKYIAPEERVSEANVAGVPRKP